VWLDDERKVWVFDQVTQRLAQLDREEHLIYAWGVPRIVAKPVHPAWQ
jgi:hypothetical protein